MPENPEMHETATVHKLSEKRKLLGSRVVSKENDKDLGFNTECSCAAVWGQGAGGGGTEAPDAPHGPGGAWSAWCPGSAHLH